MSDTQAQELVRFDADGRAELQENTLRAVLESDEARNRPVAIISVSGAYRRGKSFLLNFMRRYLEAKGVSNWMGSEDEPLLGFNWKFGKDRVTTGITIWPKVFVIDNTAVILVDTQGTFDKETNMKENTAIVAISALLSSVQIFNYHERLDAQDLMNLEFFLEYGKLVQEHGGQQNIKVFQDILFLIRDWKFVDTHPFGYEGGIDYFNDFINPNAMGKGNLDFDSVRQMLSTCFESKKCFLMPHPGDEVDSGRDFQGQMRDINEDFKVQLKIFVESLLTPTNLKKKLVAGNLVTGHELMSHIRAYVSTLNSGMLPEPKTMFNILADELARSLVKKSRDIYLQQMFENIEETDNVQQLNILHETSIQHAVSFFDHSHKLGTASHVETFRKMLIEQILDEYSRFEERLKFKRQFNELKEALRQQEQVNLFLQNSLKQLQQVVQNQQIKMSEQESLLNSLERQNQESERLAEKQRTALKSLNGQIESLNNRNLEQKRQNDELQNQIEENSRKMNELSEQINQSEQRKKKRCNIL